VSNHRDLGSLDGLSPEVRAELLAVLTAPSRVRADVIRQFFERPDGREMAETLMDLESDEQLRRAVIWQLIRWEDGLTR
jgi:hypothetical protein